MRAGHEINVGMRKSAFQQFRLLAGERPGISKSLPAIIAGENDDSVLRQTIRVQGLKTRPICRSMASIIR